MGERVKGKTLVARDEGDDASGVLIKLYGEETNGAISIIEQPFEPGLLLPPHLHQNDVWLSILEGAMPARVGDEVVTATPGCWVLKPRRIPHTMWNAGPGAPRAGRARGMEPPWRAARHPVLRRLDSGPESRL